MGKTYFIEIHLDDTTIIEDIYKILNEVKGVSGYHCVGDVSVLYKKYYGDDKKMEKDLNGNYKNQEKKIDLGLIEIKCLNCGNTIKEVFEPTTVYSDFKCLLCGYNAIETKRI